MDTIEFVGEHARTFEVRRHSHNQWELVYCTGGEGEFALESGSVIRYKEGEAVVIPPLVLHSNSSQEGFTNIHVRMSEPSFPYRTAFRVSDDPERHLQSAFQQAKFYYLADIKQCDLVLSALGQLISSYMVMFRSNSDFSEPVERIRNLILRNYTHSDFALDEAIQQLPFHYDYLRKMFKKEVGATPLEYMTRLRMKKADALLTALGTKAVSVAEIAHLCGYEDALYFSRVFKKFYGVSPSAYAGVRGQHSGRETS